MAEPARRGAPPLLALEGLTITIASEGGRNAVVEDLSLTISAGEVYGLVGESGCGKSITALSVLRLIPTPPARIEAGRVVFDGEDLASMSTARLRQVRGGAIGMIFQEPMTSLNPVFTIGNQIMESLGIHRGLRGESARREAARLLDMVGLPGARGLLGRFPHELSGGQRQRVMIAIALACGPRLLIADEPTTALDVTIQAQILELIDGLRTELGMAVLLITHDLGVIAERCHRVGVMYAGRLIEERPAAELFSNPRHPYTIGLMRSRPAAHPRGVLLPTIEGTVPSPGRRGPGCYFAPRCPNRLARCVETLPELAGGGGDQGRTACYNPGPPGRAAA